MGMLLVLGGFGEGEDRGMKESKQSRRVSILQVYTITVDRTSMYIDAI